MPPVIPAGIVAVQSIFVLVRLLLNETRFDVDPEQTVCGGKEKLTTGAGSTVIVNDVIGPVHVVIPEVYLGVTVKFPISGIVPLFTPTKAGILAVPDVGFSPILPVELQL